MKGLQQDTEALFAVTHYKVSRNLRRRHFHVTTTMS